MQTDEQSLFQVPDFLGNFRLNDKIVGMIKNAVLSEDRKYRYALWRIWETDKPTVMFICLNPSKADEFNDDPTLIRCMNFAKSWGYGGVVTANLFAYRTTYPEELKKVECPVGFQNDRWLKSLAENAGLVIAGWGNLGRYMGRSKAVAEMIPDIYCLNKNKSGQPAHPLYQPKNLKPVRWNPV